MTSVHKLGLINRPAHVHILVCIWTLLLFLATLSNAQTRTQKPSVGVIDITDHVTLKAANELAQRFSVETGSVAYSTTAGGGEDTANVPGLTAAQFESMLASITQHTETYIANVLGPCHDDEDANIDAENSCAERKNKCPGTLDVFPAFSQGRGMTGVDLISALPVVLNTLTSQNCVQAAEELESAEDNERPTTLQTWLFGVGGCTMVVIISNIGACLGPCIESQFFKRLLQFLVAMGAGSLAATGLLVLIPEAFDLMSVEEELGDAYVWKALVAILSIFTFFGSERMLKTFLHKRRMQDTSLEVTEDKNQNGAIYKPISRGGGDGDDELQLKVAIRDEGHEVHGHSHDSGDVDRKTLAWMVMAGDVMHNFVDGLAVGAAFTEDLGLGVSVCLAILCEELPHELADIAILLHSGLSIKRAVLINFCSACVVYLGLLLGIFLGTTIHAANKWIFAMAGGLFLYIPLVDMLPDMSSHLDQLLIRGDGSARVVVLLQLVGLLVGTFIIVFIVNVSGFIVVDW